MLLDDVLHMVWSQDFLVRRENTTVYLTILRYCHNGAIVTAVCGWVSSPSAAASARSRMPNPY